MTLPSRIPAALLAFICLVLLSAGATAAAPPPPADASEASTAPQTYKSDSAAIEAAWRHLDKAIGHSAKELYTAFGIHLDDGNENLTALQTLLDEVTPKIGSIVKVDACFAPKLAGTIRRAGYILLYEHGLAFIDATIVNLGDEWKAVTISVHCDASPSKVLKSIPTEYFNK